MKKPRSRRPTAKTRPRGLAVPAADRQADEGRSDARDSDTERKKEPKGSALAGVRKGRRVPLHGGDSGGSDTGGGGEPKTGLRAARKPRGRKPKGKPPTSRKPGR